MQSFSQRHGFASEPAPYDEVPGWVRREFVYGVYQMTDSNMDMEFYRMLRPIWWKVFNTEPLIVNNQTDSFREFLTKLINGCSWVQFYEICEIGYMITGRYRERYEKFLTHLFAQEPLLWTMSSGLINRVLPPKLTEIVKEVLGLLTSPRYKGPDEQFKVALRHLNTRPEPATRDCVTNAVGAVEGMANIIAGTQSQGLSKLLDNEKVFETVHGALRSTIKTLYGYRGNAAAHAQVGESQVGVEEAEYVLGLCANTLIYFGKKFP